jgi:hypothetical protein
MSRPAIKKSNNPFNCPSLCERYAHGPEKRNIFAAGLFGGLFLGLLIALARQMITKFKSQAGGTL